MNPKFEFYSKLLTLLQSKGFRKGLADEIITIYEANKSVISLPDVTIENLEQWHGLIWRYRGGEDEGITKSHEITAFCFEDLAAQMRNSAVRLLHHEWKGFSGIGSDLFVRIRKSRKLGDGFSAITIVTDDEEGLKSFFEDPDEFVRMTGEVHFSTAPADESD